MTSDARAGYTVSSTQAQIHQKESNLEKVKLQASLREDMSKHHLKEIRRNGRVPASLYGKGKPNLPLEVIVAGLAGALKTEAGTHTMIDLKVSGAKRGEDGTAVIKTIQKDPLTRKVLHVDFERVSASDVIVTHVPVVLHGEAAGVREGGILEQSMDEIEVKCRADHMLARLDVDVSHLNIGDFIHASEIALPEGVELASRPDSIVVALRHPHVHAAPKEEAPAVEEAAPEAPAAGEKE